MTPGAQFCGACGLRLGAGAGAQQTPLPPLPPIPQMPRSLSMGGGPTQHATLNCEPADAFAQALRAITATGGQVSWQQAPTSARFMIGKKDFMNTGGFTIKYDGDLQVQKTGPGQTTARFSLKVNWGSYVPLGASTVVVFLLMSYYFVALGLLFLIAILAYSAWAVSSQLPESLLQDIIRNLQAGGASAAPSQTPPPRSAPPPPPPPPSSAPTPNDTASIVEQIKQLAGLRDANAITNEEFEAKKAELLKRI